MAGSRAETWCATSPFPSAPDVEGMPLILTQPRAVRGRLREGAATAHSKPPKVMMTGSSVSFAVAAARIKEPVAFLARVRDGVLLTACDDRNAALWLL